MLRQGLLGQGTLLQRVSRQVTLQQGIIQRVYFFRVHERIWFAVEEGGGAGPKFLPLRARRPYGPGPCGPPWGPCGPGPCGPGPCGPAWALVAPLGPHGPSPYGPVPNATPGIYIYIYIYIYKYICIYVCIY